MGTASPSISRSMPAMILSKVDLPDPFKPSTPILAPGKNDREISRRIWRLGGTILPTLFIVYTYWAITSKSKNEGNLDCRPCGKVKPGLAGQEPPACFKINIPSSSQSTAMSTEETPPLVFTADELDLLGRTADALSAYMGKPVLAEIMDAEETGFEWVIFAVPLDVQDNPDDHVVVQIGGADARFVG